MDIAFHQLILKKGTMLGTYKDPEFAHYHIMQKFGIFICNDIIVKMYLFH